MHKGSAGSPAYSPQSFRLEPLKFRQNASPLRARQIGPRLAIKRPRRDRPLGKWLEGPEGLSLVGKQRRPRKRLEPRTMVVASRA